MRNSSVSRETKETSINIKLNLDGNGQNNIQTPCKFFNHMLQQISFHGNIDLEVDAKSLDGNFHHMIEDTAIALGEGILKALGDKSGINRYGQRFIPMDEALSLCVVDISNRSFSRTDVILEQELIEDFETVMLPHFFESLTQNMKANIQIKNIYGSDAHHIVESIFKAFAHSLKEAVSITSDKLPSSKGVL